MGGFSDAAADENYFPTAYSMESVSNEFFFFDVCDCGRCVPLWNDSMAQLFSVGKFIFNTIKTKRQRQR